MAQMIRYIRLISGTAHQLPHPDEMGWFRALKHSARSGLTVERKPLEPLLALRAAAGLAITIGVSRTVLRHHADPASASADDIPDALLAARAARAAWHTAVARAEHEPVRHRGLSRVAVHDAEDALTQLGRVAMLLEAHLPDRAAPPVPPATHLADALRKATAQGAKAVREHRVPRWDAVRAALTDPAWAGTSDTVVRPAARLLLTTLTTLSEALNGTPAQRR